MKITIYELLGMIKDGKAPKKIKYRQNIFGFIHSLADYKPDDITKYNGNYLLHYLFEEEVNFLNDEVEIIEEPKKIEKWGEGALEEMEKCTDYTLEDLQKYIRILAETQNELIDAVNELKRDK